MTKQAQKLLFHYLHYHLISQEDAATCRTHESCTKSVQWHFIIIITRHNNERRGDEDKKIHHKIY